MGSEAVRVMEDWPQLKGWSGSMRMVMEVMVVKRSVRGRDLRVLKKNPGFLILFGS